MSPVLSKETVVYLKIIIEEHLKLFKRLFPKCSIIPKQHYLIHFPETINAHSNPSRYNCMRWEAHNKSVKSISKAKKNYKNVPKTIANEIAKLEAVASHCYSQEVNIKNELSMFSKDSVPGPLKSLNDGESDYFRQKFVDFFGSEVEDKYVYKVNHFTFNSVKYIVDVAYLAIGVQNCGKLPEFGVLKNIYVCERTVNIPVFEVIPLLTDKFDTNLMAYEVSELDMATGTVFILPTDLLLINVLHRIEFCEHKYITVPFSLKDVISKFCQDP